MYLSSVCQPSLITPSKALKPHLVKKDAIVFGHNETSLSQKLKHGTFHVGICAIASIVGHTYLGEAAHSIADYLSNAPWFETLSHGVSTVSHWITPEAGKHICNHGVGENSMANTVAHIGVECVGPTAAIEGGIILAPEGKKAAKGLWRMLRRKKGLNVEA